MWSWFVTFADWICRNCSLVWGSRILDPKNALRWIYEMACLSNRPWFFNRLPAHRFPPSWSNLLRFEHGTTTVLLQCLVRQETRRQRHDSARNSQWATARATDRNAQAHSRESGHFRFSLSVRPISLRLSLSPTAHVAPQQSSCGHWQTSFASEALCRHSPFRSWPSLSPIALFGQPLFSLSRRQTSFRDVLSPSRMLLRKLRALHQSPSFPCSTDHVLSSTFALHHPGSSLNPPRGGL